LTIAGGRRSGIVLLVLWGCMTTGLVEMSCAEIGDRRKAIALLTSAKYGIGLVTHDYFTRP
jgi:hypothetical protein